MSYHDHLFIAKVDPALINDGRKPVHYKAVFEHAGAEIEMDRRQVDLCEQILRTNVVITNTIQGIAGEQLAEEMQKTDSPVRQFFESARGVRGEAPALPEEYLTAQREQLACAKKTLMPLRS